ncbi:MAG: hypothetical protein IGR76_08285 [Synechococcales cyanobacterium T60_A2020_003]|nr:hypothetical protein [Synechococcales cyanobacterium T60_A2020_003]
MDYSFEILGVSPLLSFFTHQQERQFQPKAGAAYVGADRCTLDAFIDSVNTIPRLYDWNLDHIVDTVIQFWMNNADTVRHWRSRLKDAGDQTILVARVSDINAMRSEFEHLFQQRNP